MKRVFYLIFSVAIVASLILSACATATESTTAPVDTQSTAPLTTQPQATAPESTEPPATAPVQDTPAPTAAAPGKEVTVTIGFTSSLTGNQEVSSKRQVNGFTLWLNDLNNAGGITLSDGTVVKFNFVTYDDESSTERVQELYTRLITEDNANFLISPYSSGLTSAASIVAEQNGKVMLTIGAAEDAAYKTGNTSLFQLYTPGSLYMASTVDMLTGLDPAAKIALVYESDKFSTSVIEGVKPYLAEKGFEVVLDESYATDTADFGTIVNKIASSGEDGS